jgi:hypothetical protein
MLKNNRITAEKHEPEKPEKAPAFRVHEGLFLFHSAWQLIRPQGLRCAGSVGRRDGVRLGLGLLLLGLGPLAAGVDVAITGIPGMRPEHSVAHGLGFLDQSGIGTAVGAQTDAARGFTHLFCPAARIS